MNKDPMKRPCPPGRTVSDVRAVPLRRLAADIAARATSPTLGVVGIGPTATTGQAPSFNSSI